MGWSALLFPTGANGFSRSNHSLVSMFFVGFRPDNKNAAGMIPGRSNYFLYFVSQVPIFGWIALNGGPQNHPKLAILRCRKTNGVRIFRAPTCFEKSSLKHCFLPVAKPSRCQAFLAGVTAFEIEFEAAGKRSGWSKRSEPVPRSQTILSQCLLQPKTKELYCVVFLMFTTFTLYSGISCIWYIITGIMAIE